MISRRRILSRSRDGCDRFDKYNPYEEEEDVWFSKDKLFKDHIQEIFNKWEQIDDEIWAKIICMSNKRRVAKAYARAPVLTINGSEDGFDGYRIGLNGFENPFQDAKTDEVMRYIGKGCRIKIDESGNIVIKRYSRCGIYIKGFQNEFTDSSVSNEIIKNNGLLELQKPCLLFDMIKFETNISRELRSTYPNKKKLENQCISCIAFVRDSPNILDLPCYVMIINIVALDLLKSKLTQNIVPYTIRQKVPDFVKLFDRSKQITDEDPYSLPANGSLYDTNYYANNGTLLKKSTIREPKPPKLPPRDFGKYKAKNRGTINKVEIPTPDYSHDEDLYTISKGRSKTMPTFYERDDDPYYSGMQARVTKFVKPVSTQSKKSVAWRQMRKVFSSGYINTLLPPLTKKKRSKSYYYSNYNSSESDPYATLNDPYEIYEPIYGKVGSHNHYSGRTCVPSTVRSKAYISEWQNHY